VLDKNDEHSFQAVNDVMLISVFNPPVTGTEVHNEDGSYEIAGEA
jgi:L-ectoine synthase